MTICSCIMFGGKHLNGKSLRGLLTYKEHQGTDMSGCLGLEPGRSQQSMLVHVMKKTKGFSGWIRWWSDGALGGLKKGRSRKEFRV